MPSKTTAPKPMTPRTQSKLNFKPNSAKPSSSAKKSSKPANGNILNFFKKVEVEEQLFCGGPSGPSGPSDAADPTALPSNHISNKGDQDGEDLFGKMGDNVEEESRYNEHQSNSKRRKLSHNGDHEDRIPIHTTTKSDASIATEPQDTAKPPEPSKPMKPAKSRRAGPFLMDSDSEDDSPSEPRTKDTPRDDSLPDIRIPNVQAQLETPLSSELPTEEGLLTKQHVPPIKQEDSVDGEFQDLDELEALFNDDDDEDDGFGDGEEFRERRYMEEQANLEAEEAGNYISDCALDDVSTQDNSMAESCPICNASLAGINPEHASVHVNACLDGNPIPLPTQSKLQPPPPPPPPPAPAVDAPELGKRFARAAVPRPGQANPISLGSKPNAPTSAFSKLMSGHAENAAWASAAAAENASRGKPAYQRTCPFYKIMPGFFICVDAFRYGAVKGCNAYFLSHFHSDHYIGLTANWSHGPIYCSRVTGDLIKSQLRTDAKWIVPLEFEQKVEVPGTQGVSVTMIPANHCPGSSLFLFEKTLGGGGGGRGAGGDKGSNPNPNPRTQRILHCGDFRACPAQVAHPLLKPETLDSISGKVRQQKIDVCYLDTTYLNPRYSFPPQDDVIRACAEFCKSIAEDPNAADEALSARKKRAKGGKSGSSSTVSQFFAKENSDGDKTTIASSKDTDKKEKTNTTTTTTNNKNNNKNRLLVVCGTYSIGKERICKAIAQALGSKIYATPAKTRLCRQLGDPELAALLTTDPRAAQVHMQALGEIRAETLQAYLDGYKPHFGRIVGFRPSGWNFRPSPTSSTSGPSGGSGSGSGSGFGEGPGPAANLQPSALPTTALLHGAAWRPRFSAARDLAGAGAAQRGSTREAACFGVPYSEHSSFRELALFLLCLRVERVVPTVNVGSEAGRRRMKGWFDRWLGERRRGGLVRLLEVGLELGLELEGGEGMETNSVLWDGKDGKGGGVWW